MDKDICDEFICGCCTFDEFITADCTERCTKKHSIELQKRFLGSENHSEFKQSILKAMSSYKEIIDDVDVKIKDHNQMLKPVLDKKIVAALDNVEMLLNEQNVDNFSNAYSLLKIHGELIERAANEIKKLPYFVCQNCSVFLKKQDCDHIFCGAYKKIRETYKNLKKIKLFNGENKI